MKSKNLLFLVSFPLLFTFSITLKAGEPYQLAWQAQNKAAKAVSEDYLHYGLRLGTHILLSSKQLSECDHLNSFYSGMFGFYVRGGYHYIYGELGLHYIFYKGRYEVQNADGYLFPNETVESRYLQVPVKLVGRIQVNKIFSILPNVGVLYQPLIHVSKNDISYGKQNLQNHPFSFTAGLGVKIKFFTIDVGYVKDLKPYYANKSSQKPSYLHIALGVQL